ncbi:MAG: GNAT family N-acetyltransferase [Acidobacteria bacterium]|nr:GNAT family N-acetyltransferase [Acidobacteriota bacterium]
MVPADWPDVERIYAAGIAGGNAAFADAPPSMTEFFETRIPELRLVSFSIHGAVRGWAAATPTSNREAYRRVIEHSVYVDPAAVGQGIGLALLQALRERIGRMGHGPLGGTWRDTTLVELRL